MKSVYITKVLALLGGYRNAGEIATAERCFYQHMTPQQAAQVIENSR